jgi:hypothetical protein
MMQDVHVKLNPGLPWRKQQSTRFFSPANGAAFEEGTGEVLHLERSFV